VLLEEGKAGLKTKLAGEQWLLASSGTCTVVTNRWCASSLDGDFRQCYRRKEKQASRQDWQVSTGESARSGACTVGTILCCRFTYLAVFFLGSADRRGRQASPSLARAADCFWQQAVYCVLQYASAATSSMPAAARAAPQQRCQV
jgi:hypothetical protein